MTKSRTVFFIALGLLILGGALYIFATRNQEPTQVFSATVNRDCAPWDGTAFTVSVQMDDETIIYISIWQAPDMLFPSTFSFPDETGQVGNAYILPELGPYETLSGRVWFEGVSEEKPIEGGFSLKSERGGQFEGQFIAAWDHQGVMCG